MNSAPLPASTLAFLRSWFNLAPDAMLAVRGDGQIVLANALAEEAFGYPSGALSGLPIETLVPEPLRDSHRAFWRAYQKRPVVGAPDLGRELMGRRRDGEAFPVGIHMSTVTTGDGVLVIVAVRDISQSWRSQQAAKRARRDATLMQIGRLALESPDYALTLGKMPALIAAGLEVPAVAILSTDRYRSDPGIRASIGLSPEAGQVLTSTLGKLRFLRNTFVSGGPEAVTAEVLRSGPSAEIRPHLAAAGFQDFAIVPLFGRHESVGAIAALAPTGADFDREKISFLQSTANLLAAAFERRHSEEQLAHAQRLEAIGQLTGGIAHDFNNLLTVISGNLQLLETEIPPRPETRETIESALRAVERGADLTRRLLAFARRQPLQPRAVVPQPLLEELGHMLQRTLGENISIEVSCPAEIPDVYVDANELDTALVNLALNARDAMPRGGRLALGAREVRLHSNANEWQLPPGRYVALEVSDTGTGMSPEVQAHMLEPFFTTKGPGKGSGLGLSMVYGFATQSGGGLRIDSRLGYGTHVALLLPVAAPAPGSKAGNSGEPLNSALAKHETILVVEDETDVRTIAARFLHALGYTVLTASGAREALEILAAPETRVDLLFSDVVLGGEMNGAELAREARRRHPELAVLLTSGHLGPAGGSADELPSASFELLRKPYRREQLLNAIERVLERR